MIKFYCLNCNQKIGVPDEQSGKRVKCPKCKNVNAVPEITAAKLSTYKIKQSRNDTKEKQEDTVPIDIMSYGIEEQTKVCPACGETIKAIAKKCKHCGEYFEYSNGGSQPFSKLNSSYHPANKKIEYSIFDGTPSQWTNFGAYMWGSVGILFGIYLLSIKDPTEEDLLRWGGLVIILISAIGEIYAYLRVKYTEILITSERIELETGIISKDVNNIDLFRVKDVSVKQGIMDRIIGIGDIIVISTDASHSKLFLRGLFGARDVYDQLKNEAISADKRRGVVHFES